MKSLVNEVTITIKHDEAMQILNVINSQSFSKMEFKGDNKAAFQLRDLLQANFINSTKGIHWVE